MDAASTRSWFCKSVAIAIQLQTGSEYVAVEVRGSRPRGTRAHTGWVSQPIDVWHARRGDGALLGRRPGAGCARSSSRGTCRMSRSAASFSFIVMMFNIPVPDGTTAHGVGRHADRDTARAVGGLIAVSVALDHPGAVLRRRRRAGHRRQLLQHGLRAAVRRLRRVPC